MVGTGAATTPPIPQTRQESNLATNPSHEPIAVYVVIRASTPPGHGHYNLVPQPFQSTIDHDHFGDSNINTKIRFSEVFFLY